jgi:hypothetical protein
VKTGDPESPSIYYSVSSWNVKQRLPLVSIAVRLSANDRSASCVNRQIDFSPIGRINQEYSRALTRITNLLQGTARRSGVAQGWIR